MPIAVLVDYFDQHRDRFGVEPICAVLKHAGVQIAPSTYYAAKTRPPSARSTRDLPERACRAVGKMGASPHTFANTLRQC